MKKNLKKLTYGLGALAIAENAGSVIAGLQKYVFIKRLDLQQRYGGGWVLVTGGSNGIGKAYAQELAMEGFNVMLIARNGENLQEAKDEILSNCSAAGKQIEVRIIVYDYAKLMGEEAIKAYMEMLENETKDIDISILINNVGFGYIEDFVNDATELMTEQINVLFKSYVYTTKLLLPRLLARNPKAAIINVASNPQNTPLAKIIMYSSLRVGTYIFTKGLIDRYGKQIDVMVVLPSTIESGLNDAYYFGTISASTHAKAVIDALGQVQETRGNMSAAIIPRIKKFPPFGLAIGLYNLRKFNAKNARQNELMAQIGRPKL